MSLDAVSQHRLEVMNQALIAGPASPARDSRGHTTTSISDAPLSPSKAAAHARHSAATAGHSGLADDPHSGLHSGLHSGIHSGLHSGLASPMRAAGKLDSPFVASPMSPGGLLKRPSHVGGGVGHFRPSEGVAAQLLPLPGVGHVTSTITGVPA